MSSSPINLSNSYLQSILSNTLQNAALNAGSGNTSGVGATLLPSNSDSNQLSPFAQLMSTLQQLQQSNPAQYQQVTQQIATNLQTAAQTAQSQGNTSAATQLNQLSTDFTNASKAGQLPNIQDLAQAMGGHHHHHHHGGGIVPEAASATGASSGTTSNSTNATTTPSATTGPSATFSQLMAEFQNTASQTEALNPMNIILNTLSSAGITAA